MKKLAGISTICFLIFFVFSACAPLPVGKAFRKGAPIQLADPTIFYHKGTYYLYGTGSSPYSDGFVVYTSPDLKNWSGAKGAKKGYALAKGDTFGDAKFWAPQVFSYNGKFYMAYTANEHIALAESDSPLGPFTQKDKKPIAEGPRQIDPFVFIDDNGKKYLYYVLVADGANRICVSELNDDLSLKKGTPVKCIEADSPWENTANDEWSVTEGPTVIKHNNLYYLVYSANHFRSTDYAVGYAVSDNPLGSWKKYAGNPIVSRANTGYNGSGHGDLVKTRNNEWLYVFHTHYSKEKVSPRITGILNTRFVKDPGGATDVLQADGKSFRFLYAK